MTFVYFLLIRALFPPHRRVLSNYAREGGQREVSWIIIMCIAIASILSAVILIESESGKLGLKWILWWYRKLNNLIFFFLLIRLPWMRNIHQTKGIKIIVVVGCSLIVMQKDMEFRDAAFDTLKIEKNKTLFLSCLPRPPLSSAQQRLRLIITIILTS